ncbi:mitochondrial substrate carrier family protein [Klebsormidium nitens]|uniref:Mitochondrial substrate carrier family protein n=1 Tax=Klebsormidium nitens TaxID=105231 RepID=A0A1Y1II38_KLENI|nr:mitochondrial substrate carrier family protein [Klebsormidium nitens]|eukprot:GAQ87808.1 mitochondrial substrate carrier family protein [Klebsormidium nitens]
MPHLFDNRWKHKGKMSFSERQHLRRKDELPKEETDKEPWLWGFGWHRSKPEKVTFSERQRLREADELSDDDLANPLFQNNLKPKATFSTRQHIKLRHHKDEANVLASFESDFGVFGGHDYEDEEEEPEIVEHVETPTTAPVEGAAPTEAAPEAQKPAVVRKVVVRKGTQGVVKKLVTGAIAGAFSRSAVAPLETIRTHLMVGRGGSVPEVFARIMKEEGWKGLFRGNGINVLRVAPSKAIELFTVDVTKKALSPLANGPNAPLPGLPISLLAGSTAGVVSTILTYPLELVKTRLTVERGVYRGVLHCFAQIIKEEGAAELYRGLAPSLVGIIPYAGSNYFAYDTLRRTWRKIAKKTDKQITNIETLFIGSAAGAFAATATFPLEVARKQMQVGKLGGRVVYANSLEAFKGIVKEKGLGGLYVGLGPSLIKLIPAAGILFMTNEAIKKVWVDEPKKTEEVVEGKEETKGSSPAGAATGGVDTEKATRGSNEKKAILATRA